MFHIALIIGGHQHSFPHRWGDDGLPYSEKVNQGHEEKPAAVNAEEHDPYKKCRIPAAGEREDEAVDRRCDNSQVT